ncbi:MAG: phosphoribosylaminoimidazolesuccinocarboxamide synthase [Candidatus Diapherotrites archaeon]
MGSVKDLIVEKKATKNELGVGIFKFTDDYSAFDYGKMPDTIPGKGESLCRMAAYNFKELEKLGVKSHFRKLISGNEMEVNIVRVLNPERNELQEGARNYLVPLELIFRNSLPEGSSVFKRVERKETSWKKLGINFTPEPGAKLEKPILDVSTKLERLDRYIDWNEAGKIAKLSEAKINELKDKLNIINDYITEKADSLGMEHADGKVEFGLSPDNEFILVDVAGTLDENRMIYKGLNLSKQIMRNYYMKNTDWYKKVAEMKTKGITPEKWGVPPSLPKELIEIVSNMYKSVCEAWIGEKIWNAPSIDDVVDAYREFLSR